MGTSCTPTKTSRWGCHKFSRFFPHANEDLAAGIHSGAGAGAAAAKIYVCSSVLVYQLQSVAHVVGYKAMPLIYDCTYRIKHHSTLAPPNGNHKT